MDTDKREDSQQPQSYQTRQAAECLGPRRHSNADQDRRKQAEERHSQNHGNCVSEVCQDQRQYAEDCQQQNQLSHQQDAWPSKPVTTDTAEDETKDNADLKIHENEGSTLSFEMTKTPAITSGDAEEDEDDVIAWEPVPVAKTRWLKKKRREWQEEERGRRKCKNCCDCLQGCWLATCCCGIYLCQALFR